MNPLLQARPDLLPLAVAYMIPVINYGDIVSDEHCLVYGAALMGMLTDEFYDAVCRLADLVGAEPRATGSGNKSAPACREACH